ncbi:MAG: hypothetical protein AB1744_14900 [Candidatus Zixiibacteriota bacterium]
MAASGFALLVCAGIQQEWEVFEKEEPPVPAQPQTQPEGKKLEEKVKDKITQEIKELRREMNRIAVDIKTDVATVRDLTNELREGDFAAGRSLRDYHGNLVRVEQMLIRPNPNTFQLFNICKRDTYVYRGYFTEYQNYTTGPRVDLAELKITFNKGLPDQITEWPKFIGAEGDNLKVDEVYAKLTNQVDKMEWHGKLTQTTVPIYGYDQFGTQIIIGYTTQDDMVMDAYINGWKVNDDYKSAVEGTPEITSGGGEETGYLWNWAKSPDIQLIDPTNPSNTKLVSLWTETYAINNDGKILNINDIASNSSLDPFTFLKQVAGESITFCQNKDGSDFFVRKNIDLVIPPDLAITMATKMINQIGNLDIGSSPTQ